MNLLICLPHLPCKVFQLVVIHIVDDDVNFRQFGVESVLLRLQTEQKRVEIDARDRAGRFVGLKPHQFRVDGIVHLV